MTFRPKHANLYPMSKPPSRLGRGLGSLIPNGEEAAARPTVMEVPVEQIVPNPYQPRKEFSDADIDKITRAYHAWRGEGEAGAYEDVPGFCKAATLEEIKAHGFVLTPGRYVGAADAEDDETPFSVRFAALQAKLDGQLAEAEEMTATLRARLAEVLVNE